MKLENLVEEINNVDEGLVIYQKEKNSLDSELSLLTQEETGGQVQIEINGIKYFYLIEISIAKDFIEDWIKSIKREPDNLETAERVYAYAINDA